MATRTVLALILGVTLTGAAWGHDHARPELDRWYESLKVPEAHSGFQKGWGCCNWKDCQPREIERIEGQLHILDDDGIPLPVPPEAIIWDTENPYFQAVGCIVDDKVRCYVPPRIGG